MENVIERLSLSIYSNKKCDELTYKKIKYGLEVMFITISKLVLVFTLSVLLGILKETLIIAATMSVIRAFAFGAHAKTNIICSIITLFQTIGVVLLIKLSGGISNNSVIIIFLVNALILYKYAPADTVKRPLIGKNKRKKLKIKAIMYAMVFLMVSLLIKDVQVKALISFGVLESAIQTTPLLYKIFGEEYDNYEKYEK